ncbi:MAG: HAMP domain-containing sensor histidine kinase, partial [Verrucomicrobiota bacterium]
MGIVAHDLRNPLTAVQGFSELILEDPDLDRAKIEEIAQRISVTARRLTEMVQKLLDANAIERGELKLNLAPCELSELTLSVAESHRRRAQAKQQLLQVENATAPIMALLDRNLAVQIFENLVSNAIKYSPPGKSIQVRLRREGENVRFEVQDEGPGLSAEDQKRLFGKFARLSAKPTGGENSTGLGLSIAKKMVEAMQGEIWCESEPDHGATFVVQFREWRTTGT